MTQAEIENVTNEILRALAAAPEDRKVAALKALRGDADAAARPPVGPLLLGMGAGARFLGVSRSTLWRVLQAGTIPKIELFPGSFRVRREDLLALAAGQCGVSGKKSKRGRPPKDSKLRDPRFLQLRALANEGDENAAADLFREFGFDYGTGRFVGPLTDRTLPTDREESEA